MVVRSADPADLEATLRRRLATGDLSLPDPASGRTADRHRLLLEFGREDLQFARMAEAHTDAVSILHEAGREEYAGLLYGVCGRRRSDVSTLISYLARITQGSSI